jgi:hypothetical protein
MKRPVFTDTLSVLLMLPVWSGPSPTPIPPPEVVHKFISMCEGIFPCYPSLLNLHGSFTVVGDIHRNVDDFLGILGRSGIPLRRSISSSAYQLRIPRIPRGVRSKARLGRLSPIYQIVCASAVPREAQFADALYAWRDLPGARVLQSDCGPQTADAGARVSTVKRPCVERATPG